MLPIWGCSFLFQREFSLPIDRFELKAPLQILEHEHTAELQEDVKIVPTLTSL